MGKWTTGLREPLKMGRSTTGLRESLKKAAEMASGSKCTHHMFWLIRSPKGCGVCNTNGPHAAADTRCSEELARSFSAKGLPPKRHLLSHCRPCEADKARNRSPAQTRTTWCGRLRTLFCFSPHLFSRRGASAGATPELPHEKRRGRGSIGWAANMSLHVGGGRRSKERRGQPKGGEVREQ